MSCPNPTWMPWWGLFVRIPPRFPPVPSRSRWPASGRRATTRTRTETRPASWPRPPASWTTRSIPRLDRLARLPGRRVPRGRPLPRWDCRGSRAATAAYRHLVRAHTTMDITPEEIHEIGLRNVAELEEQMLAIQARIGFEGSIDDLPPLHPDQPGLLPEVRRGGAGTLRPAFPEVLRARGRVLFLTKPEAPFGARRLNPALEGSQTFGYYNPPTPNGPGWLLQLQRLRSGQAQLADLRGHLAARAVSRPPLSHRPPVRERGPCPRSGETGCTRPTPRGGGCTRPSWGSTRASSPTTLSASTAPT